MKCDRCDNESTVHEVRIEAGKRREKHLCEQCARAEGVAAPQVPAPITQLLSTFMLQQGEAAGHVPAPTPGANTVLPCPACATTYPQFRQTGLLGCATCYAHFENQLVPLLARAHEGGTQHAGKVPRFTSGAIATVAAAPPPPPVVAAPAPPPKIDPQVVAKALLQRITILRKKLAEAIAAEQYENAAKLRDELARLEGPAKPADPNAPLTPAPKRKPKATGDRPPPGGMDESSPEAGA